MKKIKFIILIILLIFAFICESEIFQIELWNFDAAYFRSSSFRVDNETERLSFLKDLDMISEKNHVGVFFCNMVSIDMNDQVLQIYCNAQAKNKIKEITNIQNKKYISIVSGNTDVIINDLKNCNDYDNRYITSVSFTGDNNNINNVYIELKERYQITQPKIIGGSNRNTVYRIWSMIIAIMFIFAIMNVYSTKKEVVIRISFGESVWKIIGCNILYEVIQDIGMYFIIRFLISQIVNGQFLGKQVFLIFMLGVLLSCFAYVSYAIFNVKFAFSNSSNTKVILGILYIIKILFTSIGIVALGLNFNLLSNYTSSFHDETLQNSLKDYSYLYLNDKTFGSVELYSVEEIKAKENRSTYEIPEINRKIYQNYYDIMQPIACFGFLKDENSEFLLVNEYGESLLHNFLDNNTYNEDVLVFIPDTRNEDEIYNLLDRVGIFEISKNMEITTRSITYKGNRPFTFINKSNPEGIEQTTNPVIVYVQNKNISKVLPVQNFGSSVLYKTTKERIKLIREKYQLEENGYQLIDAGFTENYTYYQGFVKMIVGLLTSTGIFFMALLVLIILLINSMEYKINAVKLAIKKVLGYSIFEKNRITFLLIVGMDLVITLCAVSYVIIKGKMLALVSTIEVGLIVTIIELLICMFNIYRIEKRSIVKILKGGCL